MAKEKLRVKKRTTRGGGRSAAPARLSGKNIDRDLRKNQMVYSHYLLKFVAVFLIGLLWFRLGVVIGPLTVLPVGLLIGLLIVCLERVARSQKIELCLVLVATIMSYLLPIGIVI